jgi:hypothetical protein
MGSENQSSEPSPESSFHIEWAAAWEQAIQRLRPELEQYIADRLGPGEAFLQKDRLIGKLQSLSEPEGLDNPDKAFKRAPIDEQVRWKLRFIVGDEKRRQSRTIIGTQIRIREDPEKIEDPRSLEFVRKAERAEEIVEDESEDAARVRKLLDQVSPEMVPVLNDLFALHGEKMKSRAEIAQKLGWKRSRLDQRLRRLYKDLRESK